MDARTVPAGRLLTVWAHPDDEAYLAAATMLSARRDGHDVIVATATRGELGAPAGSPIEPARMAQIRTAEMERAMAIIGATEHHWLDLPDGGCSDVDPFGPTERLARLIDDVRPDTVLTFGPDGITGHADHRAVWRWTTAALEAAAPDVELLYATMLPGWDAQFLDADLIADVYGEPGPPATAEADLATYLYARGDLLDDKVAVLAAHASQTRGLADRLGPDNYRAWVAPEVFRSATLAERAVAAVRGVPA